MSKKRQVTNAQHPLRIIGGQWRGRRLNFTPAPGLRPTGDRIRETLFNWLAAYTGEARCLDLFAGSGALGLEALSRGAVQCTFVDTSPAAITQIQQHLQVLNAKDIGLCYRLDATEAITKLPPASIDIVFIDPPFADQLLEPTCLQLAHSGILGDEGLIYIEHEKSELPALPNNWQIVKEKTTGNVRYSLYQQKNSTI